MLRGLVPSGATGFALRGPSRGLRAPPAQLAWAGEAPVLEHVFLDAPGRRSWGRKKGSRQRPRELPILAPSALHIDGLVHLLALA